MTRSGVLVAATFLLIVPGAAVSSSLDVSDEPAKLSFAAGQTLIEEGKARIRDARWWQLLEQSKGRRQIRRGQQLVLIDPPLGLFFDGAFTIQYPEELMTPILHGWLGDWGVDNSLPAPPVDTTEWAGDAFEFAIQEPAVGLASFVDVTTPGQVTVSFNWGPEGKPAESADPFNFFALVLEPTRGLSLFSLGSHAAPPRGANLFVNGAAVRCRLADDQEITFCGSEKTHYYRVAPIPLPASAWLLLSGLGLMLARRRRLV